jgi:hypothetical protein
MNVKQSIQLPSGPEARQYADGHNKKDYQGELDKEFSKASVCALYSPQHSDNTQPSIPKAAMNAATITAATMDETNPDMYSLPSMNNLLPYTSSVPGVAGASAQLPDQWITVSPWIAGFAHV